MLSNIYGRRAAKPDLSKIIDRKAEGLTPFVRMRFKEIHSPQPEIGLMGFEITQWGVKYEARYKDELNNDKYSFSVTVPNGQSYLRAKGEMGVAEKAHALMLMMQSMNPATKQGILKHLDELEKACFISDSGTVHSGPTGGRQLPVGMKPVVHYGVAFPDDEDYETPPTIQVRAIEWLGKNKHHMLDCSDFVPHFISANLNNPDMQRVHMSQADAKEALKHIRNYAIHENLPLQKTMQEQGLWWRLYSLVKILPPHSFPLMHP